VLHKIRKNLHYLHDSRKYLHKELFNSHINHYQNISGIILNSLTQSVKDVTYKQENITLSFEDFSTLYQCLIIDHFTLRPCFSPDLIKSVFLSLDKIFE